MQRISKNFHSKHFHSCQYWNCGSFTSHSKMARSSNSTAASPVANATTTWLYSIWFHSVRFHSIWLIEWYPTSFVFALEVCTEQYCCWICIAKSNSLFGFFCLLSGSGLVSDGYLLRMNDEERERKREGENPIQSHCFSICFSICFGFSIARKAKQRTSSSS